MHEGHRQRLKSRFYKEGLDGFESHQVLELLLFYTIPRRDTNELAHKLIEKFGSFSGVLEAPEEELKCFVGLGENSASLLKLVPELARIYMKDKWRDKPSLDSSKKAGKYAVSLFAGIKYEVFYVICLDSQNRLNHSTPVNEGTINEAAVYPRLIVEAALRHQANSVILAHNHPGGTLRPSSADISITKRICKALEGISVNVVDHVIVSGEKYISMAEKGYIDL